jgi:anti-anti-sigma factor
MNTIPCLPDVFELSSGFQNQTVLINLDRLKKIDSLALALFVETRQRLAAAGGKLILFGTRKDVRRIFEMTKLDRVFPIFSSREEALASRAGISERNTACLA